jgi:large subunit ribosomal protein L3
MLNAILGKKIGTSRVFNQDGTVSAVTVLRVGPCTITQVKTGVVDGYEAVQIGYENARNLNKPERGHLKNTGSFRYLREVETDDLGSVQVGQQVDVGLFETGQRVDIVGKSKGRGFAGTIKRHNFSGGPKTHGQSDRHRAPGSIGAGTYPGRVYKGLKMAGHMGDHRVTIRNVEIVQSDPDRNLLLVKGSVPGARNSLVLVQKSKKIVRV